MTNLKPVYQQCSARYLSQYGTTITHYTKTYKEAFLCFCVLRGEYNCVLQKMRQMNNLPVLMEQAMGSLTDLSTAGKLGLAPLA